MTLTAEQVQDLREEFVDFKINEMSREEMADWIRTVYLDELERCTVDELEYEINSYDDNLYELLEDYVTDTVGSYTALQEFIHDRHANDWIDSRELGLLKIISKISMGSSYLCRLLNQRSSVGTSSLTLDLTSYQHQVSRRVDMINHSWTM